MFVCLCHSEPAAYIIDTVGLTIQPGNTVQRGTRVTLGCRVSVSHDNIPNLNNTFQFTRDSITILTYTTTEDSHLYELNSARAYDSGLYECRVTVKNKRKISNREELIVTGKVAFVFGNWFGLLVLIAFVLNFTATALRCPTGFPSPQACRPLFCI